MSTAYDVRSLQDPAKYDRLVELADTAAWWDPAGPLGGLHLLNAVRVPFFAEALGGFAGRRILDVGCGGGVFAEPLARAGARIVAFDASERSVAQAREHAREEGLQIDYRVALAEDFRIDERFDAVMAVDVLEHVDDLERTLDTCVAHLKPGGILGFLTHSQTAEAFHELIWQGEYVLQFIPKGNHDFHKFLSPEDLEARLSARGLRVAAIRGIGFDLDAGRAFVDDSTAVSYMGYAVAEAGR